MWSVAAFFGSTRLIYSNQDRKATFAEMAAMELVAFICVEYIYSYIDKFVSMCVSCMCRIFYSKC